MISEQRENKKLATSIETTPGRCSHCGKYRYCKVKTSENDLMCSDCFAILKRRNLIQLTGTNTLKPLKSPLTRKKKQPKKNTTPSTKKQTKPKRKKWKRKRKPSYIHFREGVASILQENEDGMTLGEIIAQHGDSKTYKRKVWVALMKLIKKGEVIHTSRKSNRVYFHEKHKDRVSQFEGKPRGKFTTRNKIMSLVDNSPCILATKNLANNLPGIHRDTVLSHLRTLASEGKVYSCKPVGQRTTFFASKINEAAVQEWKNFITQTIDQKILCFISETPQNRDAIAQYLGRSSSLKGINKALEKLMNEGKVQSFKQSRTFYYKKIKGVEDVNTTQP